MAIRRRHRRRMGESRRLRDHHCDLPDDYCGSLSKIVVPKAEYDKAHPAAERQPSTRWTRRSPRPAQQGSGAATRTLLGLQLFTLHRSNKPTEFDGSMYNPQDGNVYDGYMIVVDQNKVKVGGCVLKVLCRDQEWTRAPEPVDDSTAATPAPVIPATKGAASFQ